MDLLNAYNWPHVYLFIYRVLVKAHPPYPILHVNEQWTLLRGQTQIDVEGHPLDLLQVCTYVSGDDGPLCVHHLDQFPFLSSAHTHTHRGMAVLCSWVTSCVVVQLQGSCWSYVLIHRVLILEHNSWAIFSFSLFMLQVHRGIILRHISWAFCVKYPAIILVGDLRV